MAIKINGKTIRSFLGNEYSSEYKPTVNTIPNTVLVRTPSANAGNTKQTLNTIPSNVLVRTPNAQQLVQDIEASSRNMYNSATSGEYLEGYRTSLFSGNDTIAPGVTPSNTTADTPAGSETKTATSIPSINFFTMLGLKKFSPSDADTNEDNYGAFMPIVIKNTPIFEALGTDIENNITKRFEITLPWAVSEISDSVSVNYSRKWGTENTGAQEIISKVSEGLKNLATHFGLSDSWKSKTDTIATWFTANYDARSLNKSVACFLISASILI